MSRRRWHRWTITVAPRVGDGGWFVEELAAAFNSDRRWFMFRFNARRSAHFYERELHVPLNFYVIPADVVMRQSIPAGRDDAEP